MEFSLSVIFSHIWTPRAIFAFFITFSQYKLTMRPPSCQLTIEFIALLNSKILCCELLQSSVILVFLIFIIVPLKYNLCP